MTEQTTSDRSKNLDAAPKPQIRLAFPKRTATMPHKAGRNDNGTKQLVLMFAVNDFVRPRQDETTTGRNGDQWRRGSGRRRGVFRGQHCDGAFVAGATSNLRARERTPSQLLLPITHATRSIRTSPKDDKQAVPYDALTADLPTDKTPPTKTPPTETPPPETPPPKHHQLQLAQ